MSADQKADALQLPPAPNAFGVYKPALIVGDMCYTSGHLPVSADGTVLVGRIGDNVDEQAGFDAARQAGLCILSTLKQTLGSLDRVAQVVKVFGLVNCTADFTKQSAVVNGVSELMIEIFGDEAGVGTRSAVGMVSLPLGAMVEVEAIFQLKP